MKICVSSTGTDLSADVDPRFGRCRGFLVIDTHTMRYEAVENPAMTAGGGAGTRTAQLVADRGAGAVLTGNIGPNAFSALDAAGIKVYTGLTGTVQAAVDKFKKGELQEVRQPSVGRHFGTGGGR